MTTSVYYTINDKPNNKKLCNANYDNIIKSLIYKQNNPPIYRTFTFNSNSSSYFGKVLSKAIIVYIDVHGKGTLYERVTYDINNNIKDKYFYYSYKERKKNMTKKTQSL
jgi:hypothetical protein